MLSMQHIKKAYHKKNVLHDVSLTIPKGSCYGLVGPNGAGKSTLMKIIASVILQDEGNILFENEAVNPKWKQLLGYIPQEICLEQTVSAIQNLYFFGKLYGLKGASLQKRAEEVLEYIGLEKHGKDKVNTFSGGMKRRLNIGCALMNKPRVIIMDEPTVGIDPQSRRYIFDMITRLKEDGCTIIYASHYMEEVEELCDHVAFIDQGKIIEADKIQTILQKHAIPSVFVKGDFNIAESILAKGTITYKNGGVLITTTEALSVMEAILHQCKTNGLDLHQLELVHPRLEDVFFSLTGIQLRD